jgi:hypothetical protein
MHPSLRWTTHLGEVLDRETYIRSNTESSLVWRSQLLHDVDVTIMENVAVLTAVAEDAVERGGRPVVHKMRLTQVWLRETDNWVLIAGHARLRF